MFTPWIVAFGWLKQHVPTTLSSYKPRFNFITIHYTYLICMTLIGSILLYPAGDMAYIDALFFSSGAATQSGLNTIDVNTIKLYQQVVIMLIASVCNPIFINTFVVFIRLYWFEKRFQNVVLEARTLRRNKTRSRTKSEARADPQRDIGHEEFGVGDREIVVLRKANGEAKGEKIEDDSQFKDMADDSSDGKPSKSGRSEIGGSAESVTPADNTNAQFHRDIMFADEVEPPSSEPVSNLERIPERNKEQSIAFVQKQRNPTDKGTLRIPGPRDFDRGFVPQRIEDGDDQLKKEPSNEADEGRMKRNRSYSIPPAGMHQDDDPLKTHITIDVPESRLRPNTGPSAYNRGKSTDAETTPTAMSLRNRSRTKTFSSFMSKTQTEERDPMPYLSWTPTIGRNSAFVDLTEEQREELGGIEYRALKLLAIILVCYYVGFHLLGMICLLPWIVRDQHYSSIVSEDGINPVWWGFFTPASMFNDLGFTLTPDSMVSFQFAVLPLTLGTFLIIIGNTGFPCMLRFTIWLVSKFVPFGSGVWEELRFLLDHPRRCFTLLFPSKANWWLFWVLILLNGIDLIFFVILDLNDPTVTSLPPGYRFLDGLFQAASTRTAGFAVVNIADLHPAIQVSYLIMMYISIFPIAISMRQTNVYEEKSLGVWSTEEEEDTENSYLGTHLRRQLSFDLWYVFLGFFLIAIVEGGRLENTKDYGFTLFSVLFEIVSAYGTVGLSLGYPGVNTSFSGQMKPLSKLIMIAMQLRGRHRGLPYALDRAILLPSESLHKKEDEDAMRRARRGSTAGDYGNDGAGGGITRTGTGLSRRNSTATANGDPGNRGRIRPQNVRKFLSGALSAGPSIPREKKL
ncbi:high affinity potassium transport protein [Melanomma pulvis-pyrius CBS 109.77]|uniref:Potassium transport protein n=1 Tax=Melanomma pulvis-pyrius CBS 109.77 TaxID=1314802 RepID=A0A6A6X0L4_9PLEO|nr:high affinity potassium transport protein [Melanomma pulvis-pyrius CBS 109.77]